MKKLILSLIVLGSIGCSHVTTTPDPEQKSQNQVSQQLQKQCGADCRLDKCYWENNSLAICKVDFIFKDEDGSGSILESVANDLQKKGLKVGFCGETSLETTGLTKEETEETCGPTGTPLE
jgi:hypothetical protein